MWSSSSILGRYVPQPPLSSVWMRTTINNGRAPLQPSSSSRWYKTVLMMSPCQPIWYPLTLKWQTREVHTLLLCTPASFAGPLVQRRMMYHSSEMVSLQMGHQTWEQNKHKTSGARILNHFWRERGSLGEFPKEKIQRGRFPPRTTSFLPCALWCLSFEWSEPSTSKHPRAWHGFNSRHRY